MYDLASRPMAGLSAGLLSRRLQVRFLSGRAIKINGLQLSYDPPPGMPPELKWGSVFHRLDGAKF